MQRELALTSQLRVQDVEDEAWSFLRTTTLEASLILASSSWCCGTASESAARVRATEDISLGTDRPLAFSALTTNTYVVSGFRSVT